MLVSPVAFAQTDSTPGVTDSPVITESEPTGSSPISFAQSETAALPNTANCFDYYTFGSVQVDIDASVESTVSGTPITFVGAVINSNPYPIVRGQLLVKIYKIANTTDTGTYQNGYPVVEQFFALENLTIPANGEIPVTFDWNVPAYARSGEYELNTFFMTEKRFNLLGLPFTDDVTGNKVNFSILGQALDGVAFDKNSVSLSGDPYRFAAFPPSFSATETVMVSVDVVNDTDDTKTVPVTWTLYNWAGERVENKLDTVTDTVTLTPGETREVSYTAVKSTGAVSFVQAVTTYQDTKSILNIRFNRDGAHETRLNFPSVFSYPLVAGQDATVFSCLHSTSQPLVDDGKLVLALTDKTGALIHSYTYEGGVTGAMMGTKDTFTPDQTYTDFTLTASLFKANQKVEEVVIDYNCQDIDEANCPTEVSPMSSAEVENDTSVSLVIQLLSGLAILLLILVGLGLLKRRRNIRKAAADWSPPDALLMTLICCFTASTLTLLFFTPQVASAKGVSYSTADAAPTLYHEHTSVNFNADFTDSNGFMWHAGLDPTTATVIYRAELVDAVTNRVLSGPQPVGTRFRVRQIPRLDTDIAWWGTGFGYDSPYGRWRTNAQPPVETCSSALYTGSYVSAGNIFGRHTAYVYAALTVHPPLPIITSPSSNLSCVGNICTVIAPGPVSVGMNFPATYGKYYFRYWVHTWSGRFVDLPPGCHWSNTPMRTYGSNSDFVLPIPTQTITFTFGATNPSKPPQAPLITPRVTNTNLINNPQFFSLQSRDPDLDQIRYAIDWDSNGTIDQWTPGNGYIPSGTAANVSRIWIAVGTYTFKVLAQDDSGAASPWVTQTVTITQPPPTVSLSVTGCSIPRNASNCTGQVNWQYMNASGPYQVINTTTGTAIGTAVAGATTPVFGQGGNTIEARDNGTTLDTKIIQTNCIAGTVWYQGVCVDDHIPTLTLVVQDPVVRMNGSTLLSWTISDLTMNTCTLRRPGVPNQLITTVSGSISVGPVSSVVITSLVCSSPLHADVEAGALIEVIPSAYEI